MSTFSRKIWWAQRVPQKLRYWCRVWKKIMMNKKFLENDGMTSKELLDIDFEISVTSTSSDADIIAEVSGHFDTDDQ